MPQHKGLPKCPARGASYPQLQQKARNCRQRTYICNDNRGCGHNHPWRITCHRHRERNSCGSRACCPKLGSSLNIVYSCACSELPEALKMGYSKESKEYATASLKEYPPLVWPWWLRHGVGSITIPLPWRPHPCHSSLSTLPALGSISTWMHSVDQILQVN